MTGLMRRHSVAPSGALRERVVGRKLKGDPSSPAASIFAVGSVVTSHRGRLPDPANILAARRAVNGSGDRQRRGRATRESCR